MPTTHTPCFESQLVGPIVVAAHLHGEATMGVDELSTQLRTLRARYPDGVGALLVLHNGAVPPSDEARRVFLDGVRHPSVKGFAVVVLGAGFWAAAVRSVLTFFVVTARLPVRLFADGASAQHWLLGRLGPHAVRPSVLDAAVARYVDHPSSPLCERG